jgi:hypothetical protein
MPGTSTPSFLSKCAIGTRPIPTSRRPRAALSQHQTRTVTGTVALLRHHGVKHQPRLSEARSRQNSSSEGPSRSRMSTFSTVSRPPAHGGRRRVRRSWPRCGSPAGRGQHAHAPNRFRSDSGRSKTTTGLRTCRREATAFRRVRLWLSRGSSVSKGFTCFG